jgi:hypothetical protein
VVEQVLRDVERGVGITWSACAGSPAASPASCRSSAARIEQRWALKDGKMTALRVFAHMIDLNSVVEVGFVIGVSASTTPIGWATYWSARSLSSSITPTDFLSLR